jgi:crooked neck
MDYDTWFDYLRLLESEGDFAAIREAYEKAIAQLPPIQVCIRLERSHFLIILLNFF